MDLTHVNEEGKADMVDVSDKSTTERHAVASGSIQLQESTLKAIAENQVAKGDVLATARIAGIMAAKRCCELIPLCHSVPLDSVKMDFRLSNEASKVEIESRIRCHGRTGVEMEALLAVSVAALTIYDMVKSIDHEAIIGDIRLVEKSGGRNGHFIREDSTCKAE